MSEGRRARGRPATFDRAAALEAVIPIFWRHGYDGTSIAMLTEALGVTAPTVYSAFGSKEALYREALKAYQSVPSSSRPPPGVSIYALVEAFLRASVTRFTQSDRGRGCMLLIGTTQCGPDGEGAARATTAARAASLETFVALLETAKDQGELAPAVDTRMLARFYTAVVQGMAVQAVDGAGPVELEALVDMAMAGWPGVPGTPSHR